MSDTKPKIRFKGFTDPWEQRKFSLFFDCSIPSNTLSRANLSFEKGEIKNVHYGDVLIKFGAYIDVKKETIPCIIHANEENYRNQFLQNGDVIMADAAEDETVGKASEIVNLGSLKVVSGLHTIVCRPREKKQPYFLGYYINSQSFHSQLLPLMQGTKVSSLSRTNLSKTYVCYPTNPKEQAQIGNFFRNVDNLITLHQRKCEMLQKTKKALLEKMFPQNGSAFPEVRFKGFTEAWEQRKVSEITTMHARIGWQNLRTSEFLDNGDYLLITGTDFDDGRIKYASCHYVEKRRYEQDKHIQIQNGSILITKDGTLGKVAYVQGLSMPATLNAGVFNVVIKNNSEVDGRYLFQYLKGPYLMDYVGKKATGGTIKHLNQNILVDFPVVMPKKKEQALIGEFFMGLDNLLTLHQRAYEALKQMKQALLQKMFV